MSMVASRNLDCERSFADGVKAWLAYIAMY